ncbi:hypothetical protein NI17_003070 [Thermobifida halotolerans]|uniref:Uncharacterized protein n=2 Tax=Thermobifida halotolerans TaxID=483545 RepID=A0AA97LXW3_9ACTN|nr:hypothetical protein [Thermobifida halotolerans]UOE20242.1 hypothetical protein NI17_003070 [Thermobifida halotolerans]
MPSPDRQPRKVTPTQLLDIREAEWRPRLESHSLVCEAALPQKRLEQAAVALGRVLTQALDRGRDPHLARWPACVAAVTTGVAVEHYSHGAFWPALWSIAEVPDSRQDANLWGGTFLRSLALLGLDTFPNEHFPYVTPILMHAGIPTYCLDDVFALLLERTIRTPGLDAPAFHHWAVSGRHRLNSLDVPARRFITEGGDYALEVVDRCLDLLDRLRDDPDADCRSVGLPPRFLTPAHRALERAAERGAPTARPTTARHHRPARPRLRLDPHAHGVHVALPVIGDSDDSIVRWRITTDSGVHQVRGHGRWAAAAGTAAPTLFPLPAPSRTVRVELGDTGFTERLPLVDPEDPLLVFTDDGDPLDPRLALPPGRLWLLHPADRPLLRSGDDADDLLGDAPYGWEGWTLRQVTLRRAEWIGLDGCPRHTAHGRARPHLDQAAPVRGVSTASGSPVHAELPVVVLPEAEGEAVEWHVDVLDADTGRLLATATARSGGRVSPLERLPRPVLGSFLLVARGPLGRGLRRHVTVTEGLTARSTPAFRSLTPAGLEPADVALAGPAGLAVEPEAQRLGSAEAAMSARLRTAAAELAVTVRPPHLAVLCTGDAHPQWRPQPLRLDAETVTEAGDLLIRLPEGEETKGLPGPLSVISGEDIVQRVEPAPHRGGATIRYPLAQIGDTAAAHRHLRIVAPYRETILPVAVVSPRRLATGAHWENGEIVLDGFPDMSGVNAALYPHHAPWRPPAIVSVSTTGRIPLPGDLREGGPMQVLLAVDDPWSVSEWPTWPDRRTANRLTCPAPGVPHSDDPEEVLLSRVLAGDASASRLRGTLDNAARLWRVVGLADHLVAAGVDRATIDACARALGAFPVTALLAHGSAELAPADSTRTLISSGLAAAAQHDRVTAVEAAQLWQRLPAAAALATSDLLPRIHRDPGRQRPDHAELLEELEQSCGDTAIRLLDGEADPHARVGRFDASAEHLARMPQAQVKAAWRAAGVVPRALLDADSRSQAALALFAVRDSARLHGVRAQAATILELASAVCDRLPDGYRSAARTLIDSRRPDRPGDWRDLPAVSAALAVTARLAARDVRPCQRLEDRCRQTWTELAAAAPDLTAIDLVLAELTLAGTERARLFEEQTP